MSDQPLELFVLNGAAPNLAVALARRGPDIAIAQIDLSSPTINRFIAFTERVEQVVLRGAERPTNQELDQIGDELFSHVFRGEVLRLYNRLPDGRVSLQVVTNDVRVHRIPWEFLRPADRNPVPHQERCVVRIFPMCATCDPTISKRPKIIRILLAVADPINQAGVGWADVEVSVRRALEAQISGGSTLKVIPGATRTGLLDALNTERFDVFHFLGHGGLDKKGEGQLVLVDLATKASDYIKAKELATALAGQDLKLVVLSACLSGAGNKADEFSSVAYELLRAGIPAVIANQTSIPTKSIAPFVGALYKRLLRDGNIDSAVMAGRAALQVELRPGVEADKAVIEWGIPSLYRLPGGAQIFPADESQS